MAASYFTCNAFMCIALFFTSPFSLPPCFTPESLPLCSLQPPAATAIPHKTEFTEIEGESLRGVGMAECNRAIRFKEIGAWEQVLELVNLPKPQIRGGHVLVRLLLRPVHPLDLVSCSDTGFDEMGFHLDKNSERIRSEGIVTGIEGGVGIIEEIGEGVTTLSPGQRVHLNILFPYLLAEFQGSWQDYMVIKEEYVIPVPDKIGDEVAAQFSANPWTVYGLFKEIMDNVPKGEYVLITAAGSVVGRLFIQLAKHEGYKTIGIVRREDLKEELLEFGAEALINNTLEDVAERVKKITDGQGAYLAIDVVGGTFTKSVVASVRDGGQVILIGQLEDMDVVISQRDLWRKVRISSWTAEPYFKEKNKDAIKACSKYFVEGIWKLPPALIFDLFDFKQAMHESKKAGRTGKVLLQS